MYRFIRPLGIIAASSVAGTALAVVGAWVVFGWGPETLLDFGEAVYGADGKFVPRCCG